MNKQVQDQLAILKEIILETVPVKKIFLFGSFAWGIAHPDSDLDLYVVISDDAGIREIDAMRLIRRAIREKKTMAVDVLVSTEHNFNHRRVAPTIERQIAEEGVVLYG